MSDERYTIHGKVPTEYARARECIMDTYVEVLSRPEPPPPSVFAEGLMARLIHLDPPMLIVSLDEVPDA